MTAGQIQAPSAIEMWWVKNRKPMLATLGLLLVALFGYYGFKYYRRVALDREWSTFAINAGLQRGYTEDSGLGNLVRQNQQFLGYYLGGIRNGLVSEYDDHLKGMDGAALDQAITAAAGTERQPMLIWIAANRAYAKREFDKATSYLERLLKEFPDHFLCLKSDYPPQYRRDLNDDKEEPKEPNAKPEPPNLVDPVAGSMAGLMLDRIKKQGEFSAAHATLYQPPEPDGKQIAVFKTDVGEFKVGLYATAAPKHTSSFIDLVKQKHFDGLAFDQIKRSPRDSTTDANPEEIHVGLPATRQDDRTKWTEERGKLDGEGVTAIEFEDSGISNFPFMVAASPGKDGKSLPGRIWITSADAAATSDGQRVVFGRIIEGQDVVRRLIVDTPFATEDEATSGVGMPRDTVRVQSVEIVDR